MSVTPGLTLVLLAVYLLVPALLAVLLYFVIRFGIRDGLRGHALWLDRTGRAAPGEAEGDPRVR